MRCSVSNKRKVFPEVFSRFLNAIRMAQDAWPDTAVCLMSW